MPQSPEYYKGWTIYYSDIPRPLWTGTKSFKREIHSYDSVNIVKMQIDEMERMNGGANGARRRPL